MLVGRIACIYRYFVPQRRRQDPGMRPLSTPHMKEGYWSRMRHVFKLISSDDTTTVWYLHGCLGLLLFGWLLLGLL